MGFIVHGEFSRISRFLSSRATTPVMTMNVLHYRRNWNNRRLLVVWVRKILKSIEDMWSMTDEIVNESLEVRIPVVVKSIA